MTEDTLAGRIARFRELRERACEGEWLHKKTDTLEQHVHAGDYTDEGEPDLIVDVFSACPTFEADFIAAAANDALPLLEDCQKRITELEQELREDHEAEAQTQAAVLKINQENERLKAQMAEIIAVAHKHNWNGVTNSKILAIFLDQELGDTETLKAQLEAAEEKHLADNQKADEYYDRTQSQLEAAEAALLEISNIYAGHGHQDIAMGYFAKKEAK